ncbi:hypothetical protein T4B_1843 [Trichinella pseudospiralis]|uniref:Uncharacterized protein n=1 Tax=Trichinella pseudospiralis TaxID=6337 RepID=A0A0V1ITA6_TRIPS|nr:hypothetical protein T4A_8025 [Trichinella pseudospiralis]KRZ25969.1 hypothetical protein T4B_1843 [Trichinella pseudospiralis]KRZ37193.1 hypothetical protein T4C_5468 [Trichinella pseudospiralis]
MIKHRYGDRYLHNGALEIGFRKLDLSEDLLLIGHFIFAISFSIEEFVKIVKFCAIFRCFGQLYIPSLSVHFD